MAKFEGLIINLNLYYLKKKKKKKEGYNVLSMFQDILNNIVSSLNHGAQAWSMTFTNHIL